MIGENLILTGGNIIGVWAGCKRGDLVIGNNCSLGANAVILGPMRLGNNIEVAALALVTNDCLDDNCMLLGIPATAIGKSRIT